MLNFLDCANFVQNAQSKAMLFQKGNTFHEKVIFLLQIPRKKLDSWNDPNLYKMLNLGHYVFKKLNFLDCANFVQNAQSRAMLLQKDIIFNAKMIIMLQTFFKKITFLLGQICTECSI